MLDEVERARLAGTDAHPDADAPVTLLVLDGTWEYARNIYQRNARAFAPLRHVCLDLARLPPSEYRIRRQPEAGCVCTLEAVAYALAVLEDDSAIVPVRSAGGAAGTHARLWTPGPRLTRSLVTRRPGRAVRGWAAGMPRSAAGGGGDAGRCGGRARPRDLGAAAPAAAAHPRTEPPRGPVVAGGGCVIVTLYRKKNGHGRRARAPVEPEGGWTPLKSVTRLHTHPHKGRRTAKREEGLMTDGPAPPVLPHGLA